MWAGTDKLYTGKDRNDTKNTTHWNGGDDGKQVKCREQIYLSKARFELSDLGLVCFG